MFIEQAAWGSNIGEGTLVENLSICLESLNPDDGPNWCAQHVYMPSEARAQWESDQYFQKYGFPNMIGALDGAHVEVGSLRMF